MAKTSSVKRNEKRERLTARDKNKRAELKARVMDKSTPRNGAAIRVKLRCALTGRSRGNYRKFKLSRNMLRSLANSGQLPGVVKASW